MDAKTYTLGSDADGQPCTRLVFTKSDGTDVEIKGTYTTEDPDEQAFLNDHPFVKAGKAKGAES